jgi:Bacterial alpha-L-rhamnosidase C-terminal domain
MNDSSVVTNWTNAADGVKSAANSLLWDAAAGLYKDNETTALYPQDGNVWAIKSNLTTSTNQSATISTALRSRWGKYGAPAPEAGAIISPFISGFELEAHFLAPDAAQNAIDLMRLQWGYMLDDPLTTNSTLNEGYSTDGTLHYVYSNDQRLSHAHGWSTGPTGMLSFYVAGIQLISGAGQTWLIAPQVGDLEDVEAGFETPLGKFSSKISASNGSVTTLSFLTPDGTSGNVKLENVKGSLTCSSGGCQGSPDVPLDSNGEASGLKGGNWSLKVQ